MPETKSLKDRVREIYNQEIGNLELNILANTNSKKLSTSFVTEIKKVQPTTFNYFKSKRRINFLNFSERALANFEDKGGDEANKACYGEEMTKAVSILKKLSPDKFLDQGIDQETYKELKAIFTKHEKKQEGLIKTMNEQVLELRKSVKEIHGFKDDDKKLAKILQPNFDKDASRKKCRETGYSDYFYSNISDIINGKDAFSDLSNKKSFTTIVAAVKERIKKSDVETEAFKKRVDNGKTTREQVGDFSDEVRSKIAPLQVSGPQRSIEQAQTSAQVVGSEASVGAHDALLKNSISVVDSEKTKTDGGAAPAPPDGATSEEQKEEHRTNQVSIGVITGLSALAIGGVAVGCASALGVGLIVAVPVVATVAVVAVAVAVAKENKIMEKKEGSEDENFIQKAVKTTNSVTKPFLETTGAINKGQIQNI